MTARPDLAFLDARIAAGLSRTAPDGGLTITLTRQGTAKTPVVTVTRAGAIVVAEECRILTPKARVSVLDQLPPADRAWAGVALVELANAWAAEPARGGTKGAEPTARLTRDVEPWPEAVDLAAVLDALRGQVVRHVALPAHGDVVLVLWLAHTWFHDALRFTPYLWLTSPVRACGKTTVLELLELLSCRPWRVSNPSGPAMFRTIERERPTLLLDEIDTVQGPKLDDLTGILNDGWHVAGKVPRCVGDAHEVQTFSVFCPKAIAGIGATLADATRSRCIRLPMARATGAALAVLVPLRSDRAERWAAPLRRQLARAAADLEDGFRTALHEDDTVTYPEGVVGRDAQAWEPLLAVAELAGGAWPALARAACAALVEARQRDDDGDPKVRLLRDVRTYFTETGHATATSDQLIAWLTEDEARGWSEWGRQHKPITPHALAALLRPFKVAPVQTRLATGKARVWLRDALDPVWAKYLEPVETTGASGTSEPPLPAAPVVPLTPLVSHGRPYDESEAHWAALLADGPPPDDEEAAA